MKTVRLLLILALVIFALIQLIPKNLPQTSADRQNDIISNGVVNAEIGGILKSSCYDCHSMETRYPWYSRIAPASWLLKSDINEGRSHLNFSEWKTYSKMEMIGKLGDIKEQVQSGDMPMPMYTLIHRKSKLNDAQKAALIQWTDQQSKSLLGQ